MAATSSAVSLDSTKSLDEIPVRLRCALCTQLAVNAFRLPCCENNLCETCHSTLTDTCPKCSHNPISLEDCKPNKSLRLTVKSFLKSQEKKREKEKNQIVDTVPATSLSLAPQTSANNATQVTTNQIATATAVDETTNESAELEEQSTVAGTAEIKKQQEEDAIIENQKAGDHQDTEEDCQQQSEGQKEDTANEEKASGWGLNEQANGQMFDQFAFQGQDWNQANGFNPMMAQMQGMSNGNWSGFPNMMGMNGMNPMAMQGMYGGYGMQGMNGMTGMGMDFNQNYGWNNAQQMSSDFGPSNFYPGGYNQSHQGRFSQMHQQGFPNRFPGNRGRGRGHYQQSSFGNRHDQSLDPSATDQGGNSGVSNSRSELPEEFQSRWTQNEPAENAICTGATTDNNDAQQDSAKGVEVNHIDESTDHTNIEGNTGDQNHGEAAVQMNTGNPGSSFTASGSDEKSAIISQDQGSQFNYGAEDQNYYNNDFGYNQAGNHPYYHEYPRRGRGRGGFGRGGWRHHSYDNRYHSESQVVTPSQPIGMGVEGAPTGPRAMRDGASRPSIRGRAGFPGSRGGRPDHDLARQENDTEERKSRSRTRSRSRNLSASASRSRSPSHHSRSRHSRRRSRSYSAEDSYEKDRERSRYRHRSSRKKYEEESGAEHDRSDADKDRKYSRDQSIESKYDRKSGRREKERHRSSRSYKDSSKERHRRRHRSRSAEKDALVEEYESSGYERHEDGRRKSRNNKYRDGSRDRDYDREREHRDKDRKRRRHRSNSPVEEQDHYRSSRHSRRDKNRGKEESHEGKEVQPEPQTDEFKIQGRSRDRFKTDNSAAGSTSTKAPPIGPKALLDKLHTRTFANAAPLPRRERRDDHSPRESTVKSPREPASASSLHQVSPPAASAQNVDPHTLEREARNRERMLKQCIVDEVVHWRHPSLYHSSGAALSAGNLAIHGAAFAVFKVDVRDAPTWSRMQWTMSA